MYFMFGQGSSPLVSFTERCPIALLAVGVCAYADFCLACRGIRSVANHIWAGVATHLNVRSQIRRPNWRALIRGQLPHFVLFFFLRGRHGPDWIRIIVAL